jgi:hypothetical protein
MFDDSDTMRRFLLQFHIVGTHNCCCAFGATDAPMITTVNTQVTQQSRAVYSTPTSEHALDYQNWPCSAV